MQFRPGDGPEARGDRRVSPETALAGRASDALTRWLGDAVGLAAPVSLTPIAGGRSNLTVRLADASGASAILRQAPPGDSRSHDVLREARVLRALGGSRVPVPRVLASNDDSKLTGGPFFVMEELGGQVLQEQGDAELLSAGSRARLGERWAATLAEIHAIDPQQVGLGELGRGDGYALRQLSVWTRQWDATWEERGPDPFQVAARRLAAAPPQRRTTLVHGDPHLRNVLVAQDGEILGLLDWELATRGDPSADLGMCLVYWSRPGDRLFPLGRMASLADGFLERNRLVEIYADSAGREPEQLAYHVALGTLRLAGVLASVFARERAGAYGRAADDPAGVQAGEMARLLAEEAERLSRDLPVTPNSRADRRPG
jgi:aminoglycoside phosphotransferase (APT) family kinase protein